MKYSPGRDHLRDRNRYSLGRDLPVVVTGILQGRVILQ
jgi:hypothetical protein